MSPFNHPTTAGLDPATNYLCWGDNLNVLRKYVADESVDLIYLDPPFNSKASYNVLYAEKDGRASAGQIKAFGDTWHWDVASASAFRDVVERGGPVSLAMQAFRRFLGDNDVLAYLSMMAPRLIELHRVLKPTGSIFLHCDATAGHFLRMLLDAVFGPRRFRNEIIWCYYGPGSARMGQFNRKHDNVFWYSKSDKWTFNRDAVRIPHSEKTKANYKGGLVGSGFEGADHVIHAKGKVPEDWWPMAIAPRGREYLGYPTQKPEALLRRIIKAASNKGDVVLDPFCGCGTAVAMAERLDRTWVGIDITNLALGVIKYRFNRDFDQPVEFEPIGEPETVPDAEALAKQDRDQFEWWALGLLNVDLLDKKKGSDRGVDGRLFFYDGDEAREIIISVKSGSTNPGHVRDLRGVVERDEAAMGYFITLRQPTQAMLKEAASADFYESTDGRFYRRIQILTIAEMFEGKLGERPGTSPGLARKPERPVQLALAPEANGEAKKRPPAPPKPADPADLANDLLRRSKIRQPPVRLEAILEDLNIELSADPNMKEDAHVVPMTDPSLGPPAAWMVYYNPRRPEDRRRYTIAHEVGHVLIHGAERGVAAAARGGGGSKERERAVERFAAELLMPRSFMEAAVRHYGANVEKLRSLFLVSRQAMEIRLRELGLAR